MEHPFALDRPTLRRFQELSSVHPPCCRRDPDACGLADFAAFAGLSNTVLTGGVGTRRFGRIVAITIVLNPSVPATVSGNTATYGGGFYGPNDPADPIQSIKVGGAMQASGGQDSVSITQTQNGPSSIVIQHVVPMSGAATFYFTSARGTGSTSLAIPAKFYTLQYDTSTFTYAFNGSPAFYVAGDMTSQATPPSGEAAWGLGGK